MCRDAEELLKGRQSGSNDCRSFDYHLAEQNELSIGQNKKIAMLEPSHVPQAVDEEIWETEETHPKEN